jgi:hypothetical protein
MSLMKSLPKVARTKVLQRNIPEDRCIKDRTSCKENLHLGRKDDIIKMVQVEEAKCINTWETTGAKGRPNRARMGLAHSGGRFGFLFLTPEDPSTLSCWKCYHSQDREPFSREAIHKLERRGGRSFMRRIAQLEESTHKWRRRKTPSEASPWSTVPCLAPWWGNLLICPCIVIELEDVVATLFG